MSPSKYIKRNISMPEDLFKQVEAMASSEGRNVSNMIARLCELELGKMPPANPAPARQPEQTEETVGLRPGLETVEDILAKQKKNGNGKKQA